MKKGCGYAKMLEVLKPSSCRIMAPCPNARRCGGCRIMEMSYAGQLQFKERKVRADLEKIGGLKDLNILPIISMRCGRESSGLANSVPVRYRNKTQFPIGRDKEGNIIAGFYAGRTHSIIDTEDCLAAPEVCSRILCAVKEFLKQHRISIYNEKTGQGLVRHLVLRTGFRTGEVMVCLVLNGESLNEESYAQNVILTRPLWIKCKIFRFPAAAERAGRRLSDILHLHQHQYGKHQCHSWKEEPLSLRTTVYL